MKTLLGFAFLLVSVCPVTAQQSPSKNSLPDTPEAKPLVLDNGESKPETPSIGAADSNKKHKFTTTKLWIVSSLVTYTASALDMHATEEVAQRVRRVHQMYPGFVLDYSFESNPLARPFLKLPAPAYYACGAAFTTGINLLGYRMLRSKRFHKVWWLPQTLSFAGSMHGYSTY
jgi:hypothetical protein